MSEKMTREDIVRMAREARISIRGHYDETGSTPQELERFAEFVAATERTACARHFEVAMRNAVTAEREACARRFYQEMRRVRDSHERVLKILTGIHALLYPPTVTDADGQTWRFKSPIAEEQMQELSDRIRAIPDEIAALETTTSARGKK